MNSYFIQATNHTPEVHFNTNGELSIKGKSLPEDTASFYAPIVKWASDCQTENIRFVFQLEYMNSSSTNQISRLLLALKSNPAIKDCIIDWFYESDDEDNFDFGKELEMILDFKFNFFEYAEA